MPSKTMIDFYFRRSPKKGQEQARRNPKKAMPQISDYLPLRSKKAGRFEKLLGFARSYSIVTRGSVSLSCANTLHHSCFS